MNPSSITLITTGGTIGSTSESDSVDVTQGQQQLRHHIEDVCQAKNITLTTRSAFNKNSEDLIPQDWLTLISVITDEIKSGCAKIIITHGTDTMAYTAAALAFCFHQQPIKIVLTGSCFTLDHPQSDVTPNLLGAMAAVTEGEIEHGVYVSFLNSQKQIEVINALALKPIAYDELAFRAAFKRCHGLFDAKSNYQKNSLANIAQPLSITVNPTNITRQKLEDSSQKVVLISCYPGMNMRQLCAGLEAGCCVIVDLYHSGTGPSLSSENSLLETIHSRSDLTFLLTPLPSCYIEKPYSATITLMRQGARLYQDIQPHVLYVSIILGLASNRMLEELLTELTPHQQPSLT